MAGGNAMQNGRGGRVTSAGDTADFPRPAYAWYTVAIPAGPGGIDLVFDDDTRELFFDIAAQEVLIGNQVITLTVVPLSDLG